MSTVVIRSARPADRAALVHLAALDSRRLPEGDLLLAEVDGVLRAALPAGGTAPIADPFAPTADLVALLVARARQTGADSRAGRHIALGVLGRALRPHRRTAVHGA